MRSDDGRLALGWLLDRSHDAPPEEVPALVAAAAEQLGAADVHLYLADFQQRQLMPLTAPGVASGDPLPIDTTVAGRAFVAGELTEVEQDGRSRMWLPMLDGRDRVGVLGLTVEAADGEAADAAAARARHLAALAANLVIAKGEYGDAFHRTRRRRGMTLAAEMQWHLLPPLVFSSPRAAVAGALEPAYEVGGDVFDYAINRDMLSIAIFDAMGHGLGSSVLATVAVGAYRHGRRDGVSLPLLARWIDEALDDQFGGDRFVTATMAQLDLASGALRWINAGHPRPLLLRGGRVVRSLECPPRPPLGIGAGEPEVAVEPLEPGDLVLLFTDGVVESRAPERAEFGFERLADFLERHTASGHEPREIVRRLTHAVIEHHGGHLRDDATTLLVEWRGPH